MGDWPIGISTGCFYRTPIFECLEPIKQAGFSIIEVCSFPAHLDYHDTSLVEKAAALIRKLNLEAYSMHAPFAEHIDITAIDPGERERAYEELMLTVKAAQILKVRHLVLHPGPERSNIPASERLERMHNAAKVLDMVSARCRELGVGLVLENMLPHLFSGQVQDLLWLLGAMASSEVGICLDTGHALLSGDFHNVAHKLSGHLWMIHAADNNGSFDDHLPPGKGLVPWESFIRQLEEIRFHGTLMLELAEQHASHHAWDLEKAQEARLFLRELFRTRSA